MIHQPLASSQVRMYRVMGRHDRSPIRSRVIACVTCGEVTKQDEEAEVVRSPVSLLEMDVSRRYVTVPLVDFSMLKTLRL